ncbi:hypothetical protein SFRURICE_002740 [Spodoptera frugiperda]|nr:hypothetical protein SFRURICE_002740 [Spodoptera frugiperda]
MLTQQRAGLPLRQTELVPRAPGCRRKGHSGRRGSHHDLRPPTSTASKSSSPPDQNQTREYGASRSARALKSHQTTTDGAQ